MSNIDAFKKYIVKVEASENYHRPIAFGIGIRKTRNDKTLEVFYPYINYKTAYGTAALLQEVTGHRGSNNGYLRLDHKQVKAVLSKFQIFKNDGQKHVNIELLDKLANVYRDVKTYHKVDVVVYFLFDKNQEIESAEEGYFKMQCLSQLKVKPHGINVSGIFGKMNIVAWTNKGPILPEDLAAQRMYWTFKGEELVVSHVDKFPYMVNFHVPEGVRVVSGAKVRLGAHLRSGTTVMPAGYVNFNAGTLGVAMIEGRVSAGVIVGENSDIGGGSSIMGTLSGGNDNVIAIGKNCLLGANAGTGISLGDGCTVAAGVYITAASKISLYNADKQPIDIDNKKVAEGENVVKGITLNGKPFLLYLQDSLTGKIVARPNTKQIELNASLHG
ncbi:MAG: tetrahydrodipicolinate N-succinyltransferase N-terminal domain-containing protein [Saprospiraceae bacterium]